MSNLPFRPGRRRALSLLGASSLMAGTGIRQALAANQAPAVVTAEAARPQLPYGVMSGDVNANRAVIWSRCDREARMLVDIATTESMRDARRIVGPAALEDSDYTARIHLRDLAPGQTHFYRVQFQSLANPKILSTPVGGRFRSPGNLQRDVVFAFSGDEAGQGWGINEAWGGYRVYEAMRQFEPDFFIHSGDQIYADGPLVAEVKLDDGSLWKNIVTPAKSKVAETLDEYRGNFAYNLLDTNKRRFLAEVPMLVQWDDHEVRNNWYPDQQIGVADARYQMRSAALLAAHGKRAMLEYNPIALEPDDPERIYRAFHMGPLLDVFMLDERSYRGRNTANRQNTMGGDAAFLGSAQLAWLKQALVDSTATWKVIASDMPLSLVIADLNPDVTPGTYESWANGDGNAPSGRELEMAELLSFIKRKDIRNLVWVTADVHYASATHYQPARAKFSEFKPFWEFVGGPLNAGTFGPNALDETFGPEVKFMSLPAGTAPNRPPSDGLQFFGIGRIDAHSRSLTMSLHDVHGKTLFKVDLAVED
jgi:alkaline phosphatase D